VRLLLPLTACAVLAGFAMATAAPHLAKTPLHCHARGRGAFSLPDAACTPGRTDPRVRQATIHTTICEPGYTRRVRPPSRVTEPQKLASMRAYGDTDSPRHYEYDHLIPLELGGAPDDLHNLWPEPGPTPNPKDRLENALHRDVCRGTVALVAAQRQMSGDWVSAYHRRFG
jgi:hypothetical protein